MATARKVAPKKAAEKKVTPKKGENSKKINNRSGNKQAGTIKAKSNAAAGLRDLFIDELKDIYWAEKALTKALPKMAKNATDETLRGGLQDHLAVTNGQIERLEQVFELIGEKAVAKKCEAMAGLVKEAEEIMQGTEPGPVRDAGIISAGQKVEHYEIATYGTLAAFARILGEDESAELLEETLEEEKAADQTLTDCAEGAINIEAADEDGDDQ